MPAQGNTAASTKDNAARVPLLKRVVRVLDKSEPATLSMLWSYRRFLLASVSRGHDLCASDAVYSGSGFTSDSRPHLHNSKS